MDLCKYEVYEIYRKDISNNIFYFLFLKYFYKKNFNSRIIQFRHAP